jgi:hypothetical protein
MLAPTVFGQSANEGPVRVMRLNTPVESDLTAGGTQTFAFHLESRQLAVFVLEQKGFNAVLTIDEANDGKRLIEANVNFGFFGYERVLLLNADAPRDVVIRVYPAQTSVSPNGKFSLVLNELKTADESDRRRAAAQESILNAVKLLKD